MAQARSEHARSRRGHPGCRRRAFERWIRIAERPDRRFELRHRRSKPRRRGPEPRRDPKSIGVAPKRVGGGVRSVPAGTRDLDAKVPNLDPVKKASMPRSEMSSSTLGRPSSGFAMSMPAPGLPTAGSAAPSLRCGGSLQQPAGPPSRAQVSSWSSAIGSCRGRTGTRSRKPAIASAPRAAVRVPAGMPKLSRK